MATPSLAMIPSAYADSKVYSVLPNNGDGDFTFNRDSSATRVGQNGLIQTVGYFGNELVTNGDFATDSDWNNSDGGNDWQIVNGKLILTTTSSNNINQGIGLVQNKFYKIVFTISNTTLGSLRIRLGTGNFTSTYTDGTHTLYLEQTTTNDAFRFYANSSGIFNGEIDNVSVQEVLGDQPRLNYDISNGVVQSCPSLLLEPASTNLVTYSEDFSNAYWTKSNASILADVITSPDGSLNASKLVENTATGVHKISTSIITVSGGNIDTYSIFVKTAERTKIAIREEQHAGKYVSFNLLTKAVISNTGLTANIIDLTNGWMRIDFSQNSGGALEKFSFFLLDDGYTSGSPSSYSYTGDGTSGVYIFGAQLEALSYPTSYIPTNGSSQTRAAETCNGAGTSSTFNDSEGVLYAEISALANDGTVRYIAVSDSTSNNRITILYYSSSNNIRIIVSSGGVNYVDKNAGVSSVTNLHKVALKYKANDFALWIDGVERQTDSSGIAPVGLNNLDFSLNGGSPFYGNCKDLRVYNEALTDAQLQTLTTL